MLKNTKEKFEKYWEKLKFKSVNWWIIGFKIFKIIGSLITFSSLIWPFIPSTKTDKHSTEGLVLALVGFVMTTFCDLSDLWFEPKKDKSLAENIISFQEGETKKE